MDRIIGVCVWVCGRNSFGYDFFFERDGRNGGMKAK